VPPAVSSRALHEDVPARFEVLGAWACVLAGFLLAVTVLLHLWPARLVPPSPDDPARAYNLRLLDLMLVLEGIGLVGLGIAARTRAAWFHRAGGWRALDAHPAMALLLLLASHAAAFAFFLPPQQLLSPEPVHSGAHLAHFYRTFAAHKLLALGRSWGYDPYFLAGMPAGVAVNLDTRGEAWFGLLTGSFWPLAFATKAYIVLVEGLLPLVLYGAARLAGATRSTAILAALLGMLHWHWGRPVLGTLRWQGAHSFLFASQLVVLAMATALRCLDPNHRVRAAAFAGLAALCGLVTMVQPAALLLLAPALGLCFARGAGALRGRDGMALVLLLVLVLGLQASWLPDYLRLHPLVARGEVPLQLRGPADLLAAYCRPTAWPALAILLLAIAGLAGSRHRRPIFTWTVGGTLIVWLAAAACASELAPLARLECARLLASAVLLATLPAAVGLHRILAALQRRAGPVVVSLLLMVTATLPPFLAVLETRFFYVHRLQALLAPGWAELAAAVDATSPAAARLLFESTANTRTALSEGEPLEAIVPVYTRREVVGPPMPSLAALPVTLSFGAGQLGGRPLAAWSRDEFAAFLDRYDVGAVVAWSAPARAFLEAQPSLLTPAATISGFEIFRTSRTPQRALEIAVPVHFDYDRLEVGDTPAGPLRLRAHWLPGLRVTPPVPLARETVPGDPLGFIRLESPGNTALLVRTSR
jgi:hypothetical protein